MVTQLCLLLIATFSLFQFLGEDLVTVLDQLRIKYVIGLGEGAGANIIARFGMMHVARCLGVILVHPTSNKATMGQVFKEKFSKWKLTNIEDSGENRAIFRYVYLLEYSQYTYTCFYQHLLVIQQAYINSI
jgi:hypothetical protein